MTTATRPKKAKPAKVSPPQELEAQDAAETGAWTTRDCAQALRLLCCPTPSDALRWKEIKAATDGRILDRLMKLWGKPVSRDVPPCYASSALGAPLVWFEQQNGSGVPSLSGHDLACRVRELFGIAELDADDSPDPVSVTFAPKPATDEDVLLWTLKPRQTAFEALAKAGATDAEIVSEIHDAWKMTSRSKGKPPRAYRCVINDATWMTAIWTEGNLTGAPRWWADKEHGNLVVAVRTLFRIPELAAKGKKSAKPKVAEPSISAAELLAGVEVVEERDVAWKDIQRSPHNPRTVFDPQLLQDMEPTIEAICRLNPLTLREGSLELIDGETRHRAAEKRKPALRAKIIRCSDAQAAAIRLLTSLQRRDLNPIERAAAIRALQEQHGLSQRQLQDLVHMKQGSISNLTRLLDLPPDWQQRVISGEITATQGRDLAPWKDEPAVLKGMATFLEELEEGDHFDFANMLSDAIYDASVPIRDTKLTDAQRAEARIRTVQLWSRAPEERAFNVGLIEKIRDAAEKAKKDRELKKLEKSGKVSPAKAAAASSDSSVSAEDLKRRAETQAKIIAKRIYRFRVTWCRQMVLDRLQTATIQQLQSVLLMLSTGEGTARRHGTLQQALKAKSKSSHYGHTEDRSGMLRALFGLTAPDAESLLLSLVVDQLNQSFEGYSPIVHPEEFETLAELLDVDMGRDWVSSFALNGPCEQLWSDFCDVWSKDQLLDILQETQGMSGAAVAKRTRSDLQELLSRSDACPKALLKAKPVRLV